MPVPGKKCMPYITGEKRIARAYKKLFEFLVYRYARDESLAKKAFTQIKGRGLGELEMFIIADEYKEWWEGQWKYVKEDGQWVAKRQKKGERHRRAGKNWKKANKVKEDKAELKRQLEKQTMQEEKRREKQWKQEWIRQDKERAKRFLENLDKPSVPSPVRYHQ